MTKNTITTNEAFKNMIYVLNLQREIDYLIECFDNQGIEVTRAKLKSWKVTNSENRHYRSMPIDAFNAFVDEMFLQRVFKD